MLASAAMLATPASSGPLSRSGARDNETSLQSLMFKRGFLGLEKQWFAGLWHTTVFEYEEDGTRTVFETVDDRAMTEAKYALARFASATRSKNLFCREITDGNGVVSHYLEVKLLKKRTNIVEGEKPVNMEEINTAFKSMWCKDASHSLPSKFKLSPKAASSERGVDIFSCPLQPAVQHRVDAAKV
ncbi:hypothetical protein FOA52_014017 [Chlamydomonas sp. UWO 241]|nr:hypothetical protein FOA52_014017 [Chlamydomonas sp. UWO 241]